MIEGPGRVRVAEAPDPEVPGPDGAVVSVDATAICGSDLHAYSEGAVGSTPNVYPMVLGHEPAGTIVKTGAGVTGLAADDRGALEPALYCYHCEFCTSGHHNVCANLRFLSSPLDSGFFRELINLPVANFRPIPTGMSFEEATLAEPLAVALHSLRLASIRPDETVVVIGAMSPLQMDWLRRMRQSMQRANYAIPSSAGAQASPLSHTVHFGSEESGCRVSDSCFPVWFSASLRCRLRPSPPGLARRLLHRKARERVRKRVRA